MGIVLGCSINEVIPPATAAALSEAMSPDGPGIEKIVAEHYNPIILGIRQLEKPVVCSVNGVAAGAGANIALACDVVIAATNSSFLQAFSKIGLVPDNGGTFFLPRIIGFVVKYFTQFNFNCPFRHIIQKGFIMRNDHNRFGSIY